MEDQLRHTRVGFKVIKRLLFNEYAGIQQVENIFWDLM